MCADFSSKYLIDSGNISPILVLVSKKTLEDRAPKEVRQMKTMCQLQSEQMCRCSYEQWFLYLYTSDDTGAAMMP